MKNNWKKEFDKKFLCDCENPNRECYQDDECTVREMRGDLKNFIKSLLAEQKKELMEEAIKAIHKIDYYRGDAGEKYIEKEYVIEELESLKHHD